MKLNITCKHFRRGICKFAHNNMHNSNKTKRTGEDNTNIDNSKSVILKNLKKRY